MKAKSHSTKEKKSVLSPESEGNKKKESIEKGSGSAAKSNKRTNSKIGTGSKSKAGFSASRNYKEDPGTRRIPVYSTSQEYNNNYGENPESLGAEEYRGANKRHSGLGEGNYRPSYTHRDQEYSRFNDYNPERYYEPRRDQHYYQETYNRGDMRTDQNYDRNFRNTQGRFGEDYSSEMYGNRYYPNDYNYPHYARRDYEERYRDQYPPSYPYHSRYDRDPYESHPHYRHERDRSYREQPGERRGYRDDYRNRPYPTYEPERFRNAERGFGRPGSYGYYDEDERYDERGRIHRGGNRGL